MLGSIIFAIIKHNTRIPSQENPRKHVIYCYVIYSMRHKYSNIVIQTGSWHPYYQLVSLMGFYQPKNFVSPIFKEFESKISNKLENEELKFV